VNRDLRKGDTRISEWYDWEQLHHIHCLARSFHSRAAFGPGVIGSLSVLEARVDPLEESFDYADLYAARTMLVRMGDICLIAVLNDAGAAMQFVGENDFKKIKAAPMAVQLRELMARFALINLKLKERPQFATSVHDSGLVRLVARLPGSRPQIEKISRKDFGAVLYGAMLPISNTIRGKHGKRLGARIKAGRVSFLYDNKGRFIKNLVVPISGDAPETKRSRSRVPRRRGP
jgi:hypothetical protein